MPGQAEKGGYKHFMLKEIYEQPRAIEDTLRGRIDLQAGDVIAAEIGLLPELAKSIERVYFIACGTSHHAAMAGRYWIEQLARIPAVDEIGSEVRYREPGLHAERSGRRGEPVRRDGGHARGGEAANASGREGPRGRNVLDSAIPRMADGALYTHAGPEIGVASTKCFTAQLAALLLLRCTSAAAAARCRSSARAQVLRRWSRCQAGCATCSTKRTACSPSREATTPRTTCSSSAAGSASRSRSRARSS